MITLNRGYLITIEGIDGSGKTTLTQTVANKLATMYQLPVVATQEPGKTALGKIVKPIIQEKKVSLGNRTEFLLFAADRAQHFDEIVIPALKNNSLVLSDRMADSSLVYQGYGKGLDLDAITTVNAWAMQGYIPDLTFYVRVTPETALARLHKRGKLTAFEQEYESFIHKLVFGFDAIFSNKKNGIILDGAKDVSSLTDEVIAALLNLIKS